MRLHGLLREAARLAIWTLGIANAAAQDASVDVRLTANCHTVVHTLRGGIGASWHAIENPIPVVGGRSHGGSAWGGNPPADDDAAWQQLARHADWLGLDFLRVELEQRMFEPERGQQTWDSAEMKILYRILDWCEQRQADVFLQNMWGNVDWNAFPEFRGDPVQRVHSGPHSLEDFATSLAALMKHLTQTKRYTCIRWFSITNEPGYDWSWWQEPPNKPMSLRAGLAAVRQALDREGVRVPLSGPDWTDLPDLKPDAVDFDPFIGAYDLHSYYARFDWHQADGYPLSVAAERLARWRAWSRERSKPLFLSELGTMSYGWGGGHPGPATFEAAIKDAELVIRALQLGVDGFNRWSFVNRGDLDGHWEMIDTWDPQAKTLRKEFSPHPNAYFVYGLIARLTAKHSRLVASERRGGQLAGADRVFAAALKSPQGDFTWLVVNDAPRAWPATLQLTGSGRPSLYKYQVAEPQRDDPNLQIAPLRTVPIEADQTTFTDELPAMSLTIYSTYKLGPADRGVIAE